MPRKLAGGESQKIDPDGAGGKPGPIGGELCARPTQPVALIEGHGLQRDLQAEAALHLISNDIIKSFASKRGAFYCLRIYTIQLLEYILL